MDPYDRAQCAARLEAVLRRAAETHRRAEALEEAVTDFFVSRGQFAVADAHVAAAREHHQRACADDMRADDIAAEMGRLRRPRRPAARERP